MSVCSVVVVAVVVIIVVVVVVVVVTVRRVCVAGRPHTFARRRRRRRHYTGHTRKSYSNASETATNTKYSRNIVKPKLLFIFQLKHAIEMTTNSSIMKRMAIEQTMPTEFTSTGAS